MAAHVHATEPAGLVEMRERSFQQLTTLAEEPSAAIPTDASPIGVNRVTFGFLVDPRLRPPFRFADVDASLEIHGVLGLVSQVGPPVLHLRDLGVRIMRMLPVVIRSFLLPFSVDPGQNRPGLASSTPSPSANTEPTGYPMLRSLAAQRHHRIRASRTPRGKAHGSSLRQQ